MKYVMGSLVGGLNLNPNARPITIFFGDHTDLTQEIVHGVPDPVDKNEQQHTAFAEGNNDYFDKKLEHLFNQKESDANNGPLVHGVHDPLDKKFEQVNNLKEADLFSLQQIGDASVSAKSTISQELPRSPEFSLADILIETERVNSLKEANAPVTASPVPSSPVSPSPDPLGFANYLAKKEHEELDITLICIR